MSAGRATDWRAGVKMEEIKPATLEEQLTQAKKEIEELHVEVRRVKGVYLECEKQIDLRAEKLGKEHARIEIEKIEQERRIMELEHERYYNALVALMKQLSIIQETVYRFIGEKPNYANHPMVRKFIDEVDKAARSTGTAKAFITEVDMKRAWAEVTSEAKKD